MTKFAAKKASACLTAALAVAGPAEAEQRLPELEFYQGTHLPEGATGLILHRNDSRAGDHSEWRHYTVQTPYGPVVLRHRDTVNNRCPKACPDPLEVVALPTGLLARPMQIETPENQIGVIILEPYVGF